MPKAIEVAFKDGVDSSLKIMNAAPTRGLYQSRVVKLLTEQSIIDFVEAIESGKGLFRRFVKKTQQSILSESEVSQALGRGLGVEGTPQGITESLMQEFNKLWTGST